MRKRTGKSPLNIVSDIYRSVDRKALVILLALELGTLLMMIIYGRGAAFLPAAIALMLFTAIICIVTFYIKADKYIIIFSTALVNTGLMAQVMESSLSISVKKYLICTVVLCSLSLNNCSIDHHLLDFILLQVLIISDLFFSVKGAFCPALSGQINTGTGPPALFIKSEPKSLSLWCILWYIPAVRTRGTSQRCIRAVSTCGTSPQYMPYSLSIGVGRSWLKKDGISWMPSFS